MIFTFSILLHYGKSVIVDCKDSKGYTPLFYAAKAGWLSDIIELINHGANVNHRSENGSTPLFEARNYNTALLLLKHGADPNLKGKNHRTNIEQTAIEYLMENNKSSAKAILDSHCTKQDNYLVMDFHIFDYNDKNEEKKSKEFKEEQDEMSLFHVIKYNRTKLDLSDDNEQGLLLHPLMQIFLNFKYKTVRQISILQAFFHLILAIVLTINAVKYTELVSCEIRSVNQDCLPLKSAIKLDSNSINQLKTQMNPTFFTESNNNYTYNVKICQKEEKTCFVHYNQILCNSSELQCIKNTIRLTQSNKNFLDVIVSVHNIQVVKCQESKVFKNFWEFLVLLNFT